MEIRPLTLADSPDWAALLAAAFDRSPSDMARLLAWLHLCYPMIAYGVWAGDVLAAQYSCLVHQVRLPRRLSASQPQESNDILLVGMSVNMATHPAHRGRGLIKHASRPVYDALLRMGAAAGVGFSNAEGVQVDRKSKGYGYRVVGRLTPTIALLHPSARRRASPLTLSDQWDQTADHLPISAPDRLHFIHTPEMLRHRFAGHPFRTYQFGVWHEDGQARGIVVFRLTRLLGLPGASLLAAAGDDLPQLLRHWSVTLAHKGVRVVHLLSTPHAQLRSALGQIAVCLPQPISRNPYYLTAKPLSDHTAEALFTLDHWDCVGGDVL